MTAAMLLKSDTVGPAVRAVPLLLQSLYEWPDGEPFPVSPQEAVRLARHYGETPQGAVWQLERIFAGGVRIMGHRLEVL